MPDDAVVVEDIPLLVETGMAPMFPLVVVVTADDETRVERLIKHGDGRGRRPGAHRGAGPRGAAPRDRRCAAGQFGHRRMNSSSRPATCGTTGCCRWRTTSHTDRPRATEPVAGAVQPGLARRGAPDRRAASKRLAAQRLLRVDHIGSTAVPGYGCQGRHRHPGHGRLAGRRRRARRRAGRRRLPVRRPITADVASPMPAAPSRRSITRRCGLVAQANSLRRRSRPTGECPCPGRRLARSAVRAAVPRLADAPTRGAQAEYLALKRRGAERTRLLTTPRPRSRGSPTPTGARGSGPTPPAGGPRP